MEEIIRETFSPGKTVEILLRSYKVPTVGVFMKCNDGCVMIRTLRGDFIIINIADIVRITLRNFNKTEIPEVEQTYKSIETDEEINEEPAMSMTQASESDLDSDQGLESVSNEDDESDEIRVADFINNDLFKLPTEKPGVKVVGHIDLSAIRDTRKKSQENDFESQRGAEMNPRSWKNSSTYPTYFYTEGIRPKGKIIRKGPAFGFIMNKGGNQVYMNCNEILTRGRESVPAQGDDVVFTSGTNQQGEIAKCVHFPMSIGEQLELIEEIMGRDRRNARLLALQLLKEYPNDENVNAALQALGIINFNQGQPRQRFDVSQVLDMIDRGQHVDGKHILMAERELGENAVYDDYKHYAETLLNYAKEEEHAVCYQLLSRMIKMARANDSEEDARDIIDKAVELYKDENENICRYFQSLREPRGYSAEMKATDETVKVTDIQQFRPAQADTLNADAGSDEE